MTQSAISFITEPTRESVKPNSTAQVKKFLLKKVLKEARQRTKIKFGPPSIIF
jgi:hypothetical protein